MILVACIAPAAHAQDDPGLPDDPTGATDALQDPGNAADGAADTDTTPVAKEGMEEWRQVGGALFPEADDDDPTELIEGSPTTYADNLYDVSFSNTELGIAGGSTCEASDPDRESGCRPVAYLYTNPLEADESWDRVELPGSERPGFIGAIAWMTPTVAMAVGGTGTYPRREPPYGKDVAGEACEPPDRSQGRPWGWNCDQAGEARAWLYLDGEWCELGHGSGCPDLPRDREGNVAHGLTAVDFRQDSEPVLGFAGGLGQIFRWQGILGGGGSFDRLYDNASPPSDLQQTPDLALQLALPQTNSNPGSTTRLPPARADRPKLFNFRVRDIRFAPTSRVKAFAVTSGCCGRHETQDRPLVLTYSDSANSFSPGFPAQWFLHRPTTAFFFNADPDEAVERANSWGVDEGDVAVGLNDTEIVPGIPTPGVESLEERGSPLPAAPATKGSPDLPGLDSLYSITTAAGANSAADPPASILWSTASTESNEQRSIAQCFTPAGAGSAPASRQVVEATLSTARLLAIDGAVSAGGCSAAPDWAVGELRSAAVQGQGRRGLVAASRTEERTRPGWQCDPLEGSCDPGAIERDTREQHASLDFLATSYTLNSLEMVGQSGEGWAVGDHGAILRLGGSGTIGAGAEPAPPTLGARRVGPLADKRPYESPPHADRAGAVPPLALRPRQTLAEPRLVGTGSPDATHDPPTSSETEDVAEIVISRDGTEGWAIGPNPRRSFEQPYGAASFYHYDGSTWTRCDPEGIRAQLAPDPACASVAGLRSFKGRNDTPSTTKLVSAARVPLEKDGDPTNDDEFEVVAVGTSHAGDRDRHGRDFDPVILRYRDGRWGFEEPGARVAVSETGAGFDFLTLKDVAFTAPDDGWILGRGLGGVEQGCATQSSCNALYHYDGERWERCPVDAQAGSSAPGGCGSERIPDAVLGNSEGKAVTRVLAAGDRVYLYGHRGTAGVGSASTGSFQRFPYILYRERGGEWTDGQGPGEDGGGYDPAWQNPSPGVSGTISSLAVTQYADGSYSGWAQGRFYDHDLPEVNLSQEGQHSPLPPAALLMRLEPGAREWEPFRDPGALEDYLRPQEAFPSSDRRGSEPNLQVSMPGPAGHEEALIAQRESGRLFRFDPGRERWEVVASDRPLTAVFGEEAVHGSYQALAPDGQGGLWAAVKNVNGELGWPSGGQVFFHHYTDRPPQEVFSEAPLPFGDESVRITGLAGAPDGSLWVGTDSSLIARYDRTTGWETAQVPGWDPGRIVTRTSRVNAVAVGPDGSGVAVGEGGRIANISPDGVQLDRAASQLCEGTGIGPGCGTSRDLRAAAVAPDGSALVGGDSMAALWRPPGAPFQRIAPLPGGSNTDIASISMPSPDRAWIATDTGFVLAGQMIAPGEWSWGIENRIRSGPDKGRVLGAITADTNLGLRSIAIDPEGRGYAVGDKGLVLERTGEDEGPWRRLRAPGTDDLTSVTLAVGSEGALIGGRNGLVLTAQGARIEVARHADYFRSTLDEERSGPLTGPVAGMALLPGIEDGQTEAWVAVQARGPATNQLLHYTDAPEEPLLDPRRGTSPLPDAPREREGELRFAAFGKSDCDIRAFCLAMIGTRESSEQALRRIVTETRPGGPAGAEFALFTGDATDSTGVAGTGAAHFDRSGDPVFAAAALDVTGTAQGPKSVGARKHRRFAEFVADPLDEAGTPFLGAIGSGDLSRPLYRCGSALGGGTGCSATPEQAKAGDNLPWREALESRPAPWGGGGEIASASGLGFQPADGSDAQAESVPDATVDADGEENLVRPVEVKGGARTHYAADVLRGGEEVARIVVVDSSLRDLSTGDPLQQPIERGRGQLEWLERMLCFEGQPSPSGGNCTREPDQRAIVLSNTPTYSYGPIDPTALATDGAVLESLYLRYRVSVVISGRLGWNGLYYTMKPGLHTPCPGDPYPEHPPAPGVGLCESVAAKLPVDPSGGQADPDDLQVQAEEASGAGVSEITDDVADADGLVPFVVASGAGGKFGPNGDAEGSASEGFWHGYTIVRVAADGDPRGLIVEQRPIFDWLTIEADERAVHPRQRLELRGVGREPIAFSWSRQTLASRYDEITSAAITHRYDLLLADPDQPWLPCREGDPGCESLAANLAAQGAQDGEQASAEDAGDECSPYLCLPGRVGTVNRTTGQVRAGDGRYPETFAVALLSVGAKSATYPLVFERSPSFVVKSALRTAGAPLPLASGAGNAPPPPDQPPLPRIPQIEVPAIPAPPSIPPLAAATPPEPTPPAPPAPPPPAEQPAALDLTVSPAGLTVATPAAVIQPPTPPVNPAPPSGARREARQRQAAAQKGGAEAEDASSQASDGAGDLATGRDGVPGAQEMSRHDPRAARQENSYARRSPDRPTAWTPVAMGRQPSAGSSGLLWGGGLAIAALALALSFTALRPRSRRREPELPAPALSRIDRRR